MAAKSGKSLRAVGADEKPEPKKPKRPVTIKAAAEGSERELLVAMRTKVAAEIDAGVPAHALAPLLRQLHEFDKAIRAMDARDADESGKGSDGGSVVADEDLDASAV